MSLSSRQAKDTIAKKPHGPVQASSPARVPSNQQPLKELVALDAGRRGRLRSQDRGALFASSSKAYRTTVGSVGLDFDGLSRKSSANLNWRAQSTMHGTSRRNFRQPLPLSFRKISNHNKFFFNSIDQLGLAVRSTTISSLHHCICESDLNIFKRPTLSVSVHPHGYAGTCTQCCQ